MNKKVVYQENPTSLSTSSKTTVAMYLIWNEYRASDGKIKKGRHNLPLKRQRSFTPAGGGVWEEIVWHCKLL